jgi:hypothetical protein
MSGINDSNRIDQIARLLKDYKEREETRSETIPYRDALKTIEVIRIDPNILLLNPHNSRLTAQLKDHPQKEIVDKDSASEGAQEILASILSKTDQFSALKRELKELKQQEVGLISRKGLLINGNTRAVALRQLGEKGMDVAVLPEDADDRVFLDLEMALQMTRLTHQDYTFTNELLLMNKYSKYHGDKQLAMKMGWLRGGERKIQSHYKYLNLIDEVRGLAEPPIRYQEFDSKKQHIVDLVENYEQLKHSPKEANNMKWMRVASIFLGVNKDQTRAIDEEFIEKDIVKQIEAGSKEEKFLEGLKKIAPEDGLDDFFGDDSKSDREKIDPLLLAKKVIKTLIDSEGYISKDLTPELEGIHNAIRRGSESIINKTKDEQFKKTPLLKLQEARELIEAVVLSYHEVKLYSDFKKGDFLYHLRKIQSTLDDLTTEVKNTK